MQVTSKVKELEDKIKQLQDQAVKQQEEQERQREHELKETEIPLLKSGVARPEVFQEKFSFADKFFVKNKPEKSFLVTIMFSNGTLKTFVIVSKEELFKFRKRNYYLRYENAWYDNNHKMYHLFFFDDYVCPIEREIQQIGDKEYFAVKPSNVAPVIKMEYVKALSSIDMMKWLKLLVLVVFIGILVNAGGVYYGYHADSLVKQLISQFATQFPAPTG